MTDHLSSTGRIRVLIACECSGIFRDAFIARGYDAISCDIQPTDRPGPHYQGDVMDVLDEDWDLMVAHPDCTYACRAGQRWLKGESMEYRDRWGRMIYRGAARVRQLRKGARFFNTLRNAHHIPFRAIENPRPGSHAIPLMGKPTQFVQPWMFGDPQTKETGWWLDNLPPLEPTKVVAGRGNRVHSASPGPQRAKLRAESFPGMAAAAAAQWGSYVEQQIAARREAA